MSGFKSYEERIDSIMAMRSAEWWFAKREILKLTQSPIEVAFAEAIVSCESVCGTAAPRIIGPEAPFEPITGLQISPQRRIGNYRADFALVFSWFGSEESFRPLVVECDGHNFHEKTKDQAARDKARDRYFLMAGWSVMRFTGSELHADAWACADTVGSYLAGELEDGKPWRSLPI